jgi:GAF domain-containing protein
MAVSIQHQLRQVGAAYADGQIDHPTARQRLVTLIREHFQCSRVSYWQFDGEPGERVMQCVVSCGAESPSHVPGSRVLELDAPAYFQSMSKARMYVCEDTLTDPNFESLRDRYRQPGASRGMLDACLSANGKLIGVLCLEQVDEPRKWTRPEVMMAMRFATAISMFIARLNSLATV